MNQYTKRKMVRWLPPELRWKLPISVITVTLPPHVEADRKKVWENN